VNKLNNDMQGFDLSIPDNVNTMKNLGYSLYADENVMNPVMTTRRMNALAQDIHNKTNGKNAKDYDNVYGEYLMNQYSDWMNDGKQGTGYSGPTELPQGSFDQYQDKLQKGLAKLTPDLNEAPQGTADALNYYQVGDKFIKKERVQAFINANTTEQDRAIINAHAWKGFQGYSDQALLQLQTNDYNSKIKSLQDNYNYLQIQKSLVKNDWQQTELFTNQMNDLQNAIESIKGQRGQLPQLGEGQGLPKQYRENLQSNLFNTAFQDDMTNAWAFDQKKTELKTNQGRLDQIRLAQSAYQFGKMYDIHLKELGIKEREEQMKEQENYIKLYGMYGMGGLLNGPAGNAPLSLVTTLGKDNATVVTNDVTEKADAAYVQAANQFNTLGYNYLMSKDANLYGKWLTKDADGNWTPKDQKSADIVNQGIQQAVALYGNVANMSIKERNGLKLSDDDLAFFGASQNLKQAELYKNQMKDLAEQVFRSAGLQSPYSKTITIHFKNGTNVTKTYAELKEMADRKDPLLDQWKGMAKPDEYSTSRQKADELTAARDRIFKKTSDHFNNDKLNEYNKAKDEIEKKYSSDGFFRSLGKHLGIVSNNSLEDALHEVNSYYDSSDVNKAWESASKTFNVYGATPQLPKGKDGKLNSQLGTYLGDQVRSQHPDLAGDVKNDDMDITKVYPVFDANNSDKPVKYMAEVRYRKGAGSKKDSGDKITTVDLTDQVMRDHDNPNGGGFIGNLFPADNAEVVYGMLLNNSGATPMDQKDGYTTALQTHSSGLLTHKYQIVSVKNPSTQGVDSYRVNILVPKGKDQNGVPQYQVIPVQNFDPNAFNRKVTTFNFPANFKYVSNYMDYWFSDSDKAKEFYALHNIPYNQ
jgi:hypothetical protein